MGVEAETPAFKQGARKYSGEERVWDGFRENGAQKGLLEVFARPGKKGATLEKREGRQLGGRKARTVRQGGRPAWKLAPEEHCELGTSTAVIEAQPGGSRRKEEKGWLIKKGHWLISTLYRETSRSAWSRKR